MNTGQLVNKYLVAARFGDHGVAWSFGVETEDGKQHEISLPDEPVARALLELARSDETLFFDPKTKTLSTGWNNPGT